MKDLSDIMRQAQAMQQKLAEALQAFPGARILRVDAPGAEDEIEDEAFAASNVIRVDFGSGRRDDTPRQSPFQALDPPLEEDDEE